MSKYLLLLARSVHKSKLTQRGQVQPKGRTKSPKSYITRRRNMSNEVYNQSFVAAVLGRRRGPMRSVVRVHLFNKVN